MRELIPAVKALWAGDYTHDGEYWKFPKTTASPRPLQQPGPPIWVAARDPNSHEFAVAQGCNVQVTPLHLGDEEVVSLMDRFNAACAATIDVDGAWIDMVTRKLALPPPDIAERMRALIPATS